MFANVYQNCRVFLTGHTGFKGSWLALWLKSLGAQVTGLALDPETSPNHWDLLKLGMAEHRLDIRDAGAVARVVKDAKPDIVFHLAAQPLVRRSYRMPQETWGTNVMGTVNLMEACRETVQAMVIITSDKCYENRESSQGYTEEERLGGHDPYSASKAGTELAVASYRDAIFKSKPLVATTRAGNVIGGGDWSEDRLIPDLARAQARGEPLIVRSPESVRPWQHVLEPLAGYLQLGQELLQGNKIFQGAWNFGPEKKDIMSVSEILKRLKADYKVVPDTRLHETKLLMLDSAKARKDLKWRPLMSMDRQLDMTAEWYRAFLEHQSIISQAQLETYQAAAKSAGVMWAS